MYEGMSFGGWTVVGPYVAGGPDAHIAANSAGEEAVLRVTALSDPSLAEALTKAAEAAGAVTHPNVAKVLAWGVAESSPPAREPEPAVMPAPAPIPDGAPVPEPVPAPNAVPEPAAEPAVEPAQASARRRLFPWSKRRGESPEEPPAEPTADAAPAPEPPEAAPPIADTVHEEPSVVLPGPDADRDAEDEADGQGLYDEPGEADPSGSEPGDEGGDFDELSEAIAEATGLPASVPVFEPAAQPAPAAVVEPAPEPAAQTAPRTLFWCAEEFVPGTNLQALFGHAGGRMPVADAAHWAAQLCAGLSALHAHRVVLGDLRPETIIVTPEGDARITCVAPPRLTAPLASAAPEAAHYLNPELAVGGQLTPQSDVYSLGAVMYRAVTGSVPFDALSAGEVATLHGTAIPEPLRRINPQVPASFEQVVLRALAKDPSARYGSAEELRQDLERVAAGASIMGRGVPMVSIRDEEPREKRRMAWWAWALALAGVFVLLAAVGAWAYSYFSKPAVPDVAGMTEIEASAVLTEAGLVIGDVGYRSPVPSGSETGTVLGQDPPAGQRAAEGSLVDIIVAGAKTVQVPSVVGMSQGEAISMLQRAGFILGAVETTSGALEDRDKVISQSPAGATDAAEGSPVSITICSGPELASVPSVTSTSQASAIKALEAAGFTVTVQTEASSLASGTVLRQAPAGGTTAVKGGAVTIWVALRSVPNVIGQRQATAIDQLRAVGLSVSTVTTTHAGTLSGRVFDQDPDAGTPVTSGMSAKIWVAK